MPDGLKMCVLFRSSKKTGKIDTTLTGVNFPLLKLWALKETTKTKQTLIFDRDTGTCLFHVVGSDNLPKVQSFDNMTCDDFNIPLEELQKITDDRFDK